MSREIKYYVPKEKYFQDYFDSWMTESDAQTWKTNNFILPINEKYYEELLYVERGMEYDSPQLKSTVFIDIHAGGINIEIQGLVGNVIYHKKNDWEFISVLIFPFTK